MYGRYIIIRICFPIRHNITDSPALESSTLPSANSSTVCHRSLRLWTECHFFTLPCPPPSPRSASQESNATPDRRRRRRGGEEWGLLNFPRNRITPPPSYWSRSLIQRRRKKSFLLKQGVSNDVVTILGERPPLYKRHTQPSEHPETHSAQQNIAETFDEECGFQVVPAIPPPPPHKVRQKCWGGDQT